MLDRCFSAPRSSWALKGNCFQCCELICQLLAGLPAGGPMISRCSSTRPDGSPTSASLVSIAGLSSTRNCWADCGKGLTRRMNRRRQRVRMVVPRTMFSRLGWPSAAPLDQRRGGRLAWVTLPREGGSGLADSRWAPSFTQHPNSFCGELNTALQICFRALNPFQFHRAVKFERQAADALTDSAPQTQANSHRTPHVNVYVECRVHGRIPDWRRRLRKGESCCSAACLSTSSSRWSISASNSC